MSTNRNVSTLPLDALRSVSPQKKATAHFHEQIPLSRNKDQSISNSIDDKNLQLFLENQKLRRCLSLFMENASLKTANILSSVMSMCDDKLRNFITENIIDVPQNNTAAASVCTKADSPKQLRETRDPSVSYGVSFKNININDLGSNTFESYDTKFKTSNSPRRVNSPGSQSGSLRPPMRFGVGKSPYNKAELRSPTGHSVSPKSHNSSFQQGQSQNFPQLWQKPNQSENKKSKSSKGSSSSQGELYDKGTNIRPNSAPPVQKLAFDNGQFKINKNSAFSQVNPGSYVVSHEREKSLPVNVNVVKMDKSPVSNYHTAQHLLYDSLDQSQGLHSEHMSNQPQVSTNKKIKRHLAKSVTISHAPTDSENYPQPHTEYVQGKQNTSAIAGEDYISSPRSSYPNSSHDEDMTMTELQGNYGMERVSLRTDLNHDQDTSTQRGTRTERLEEIGTPQASSTPVQSQKQHRPEQREPEQREENTLLNELLAYIMGMKGPGANEKAMYVLHRPLDVLIGYTPDIPEEAINRLATSKPNKRLIGEIAFQLDRRILEYVFAVVTDKQKKRRSRYYGYSVASIMMLISKEVQRAGNDPDLDACLRERLENILQALLPLSYDIERHPEFTQDIVNKYGLLNGTPEPGTVEDIALSEPAVMRLLIGQLVKDEVELDQMLIILDCLHFMAHHDKGPLFIW